MADKSLEVMTAETLAGDLRDVMLTHIRAMQTPWSKLSEAQQTDKIYAISNACEAVVKRAVAILAERKFASVHCSVTKFTVKDGIKAEIAAVSSSFNIEKMAEGVGEPALLVFASAESYLGEKAPAKADPDQPSLPVEDDVDAGEDEPSTPATLQPMETEPEEPTLTPYEQGEGSAKAGLGIEANPFTKGTPEYELWLDGFEAGYEEKNGDAPDADPSDAPEA